MITEALRRSLPGFAPGLQAQTSELAEIHGEGRSGLRGAATRAGPYGRSEQGVALGSTEPCGTDVISEVGEGFEKSEKLSLKTTRAGQSPPPLGPVVSPVTGSLTGPCG